MNGQITFQEYREYSVNLENLTLRVLIDSVPDGNDEDAGDLTSLTTHRHSYAELFVCRAGKITISTDTDEIRLDSGDAALIPINFQHKKIPSEKDAVWRSVGINCVRRHSKGCRDLYKVFSELCMGIKPVIIRNNPEICGAIAEISVGASQYSGYLPALRMAEVLSLISESAESGRPEKNPAYGGNDAIRMSQLDQLVNICFMNELTAAQMAEKLFISERQLARIARKRYGTTLHRAITAKKLTTAETLLRLEKMTCAEIGAAVGYNSKSCFYRDFRKRYGTTPSEYRERLKR